MPSSTTTKRKRLSGNERKKISDQKIGPKFWAENGNIPISSFPEIFVLIPPRNFRVKLDLKRFHSRFKSIK